MTALAELRAALNRDVSEGTDIRTAPHRYRRDIIRNCAAVCRAEAKRFDKGNILTASAAARYCAEELESALEPETKP